MARHVNCYIGILLSLTLFGLCESIKGDESPETYHGVNSTLTSRSYSVPSYGIEETGRSPHYHLAGLVFDFIITPLLNAGLTVVTLGTGGFLSVILNLTLAAIRHFAGFLWKAFKLWLKVHSFGWGWGFPFSSHTGWGWSGWKRDLGSESFLL